MNTSNLAYKEIKPSLGTRQTQVVTALKKMGHATNSMLSHFLHLPINCITGRTNELRKKGIVIYSHTSWDPFTKNKCNYWKLK